MPVKSTLRTVMEDTSLEENPDEEETEEKSPAPVKTITTYVVVPPDGGWGWVIVAASFICNVMVDGIVFSYGAILNHVMLDFKTAKSVATIPGALLSGFYLIAGPFISALSNRYGFRTVSIAGSIVGGLAFAISSFSSNIILFSLFYGVVGGIGFGLIYVPAVIACGFYFEKWRALATGIAVTGSGMGTIVMGPIITWLIKEYGWRGTVLIQAGFIFHCAVFGALFRPLKPTKVIVPEEENPEDNIEDPSKLPLLQRIKIARDELLREDSKISLEHDLELIASKPIETNKILKANNNITYPSAAEIFQGSHENVGISQVSLNYKKYSICSYKMEKRLSVPAFGLATYSKSRSSINRRKESHSEDETFHPSGKRASRSSILETGIRRDSVIRLRNRTFSESSNKSYKGSRRNTATHIGARPLYREDIFYHGSMKKIPQYNSRASGMDYRMSVSRLPTANDVQEEKEYICQICPEAVRRTLATMLDFSLIKSLTFLLFCSSGFFTMMGLLVPFMFVADRAQKDANMTAGVSILLVSTMGITNTVGRIICGLAVSGIPNIDSLWINNIALTVAGASTMFSYISMGYAYQYAYASIFGLSIACWASLRSILIVDLMGLENLTNAFGLLLLFQGVAAVIGTPLAGFCLDITDSYEAPFLLSGGLLLISGIMGYPLKLLSNWEEKRKRNKASINEA